MLFSSVLGWWIAMADEGLVEARFQPEYVTPQAGAGAAFSSTSQKSEVLEVARKVAPVWKFARLPPPCCPQTGLWKFQ